MCNFEIKQLYISYHLESWEYVTYVSVYLLPEIPFCYRPAAFSIVKICCSTMLFV